MKKNKIIKRFIISSSYFLVFTNSNAQQITIDDASKLQTETAKLMH